MIRLGAHISSAGGVDQSALRAHALGCDAYQIFSASPRQWRTSAVDPERARELTRWRQQYELRPLVIHANYLINLAGANPDFQARSRLAFRGELERALALEADYLVLHPGSYAGSSREEALVRLAGAIQECARGLAWGRLTLLIENTAGAGSHLGGEFAEVAAILDRLERLPVACCIDTCHAWAAGYDLVTAGGYEDTMAALAGSVGIDRVPVFHVNDAKAARGSHLDRHEHIGAGQLGTASFARLLQDGRWKDRTFILETPVDNPTDQARDLAALRSLAGSGPARRRG